MTQPGPLDRVRKLTADYCAAHILAGDKLTTASLTPGLPADVQRDLRLRADRETDIAAQFGTIAATLDRIATDHVRAAAVVPAQRVHTGTIRCADAGAYVWDGDES
jgi:hypothetical protein